MPSLFNIEQKGKNAALKYHYLSAAAGLQKTWDYARAAPLPELVLEKSHREGFTSIAMALKALLSEKIRDVYHRP